MAYEYDKQTWVDNETPINAERMNHIEDGIHGSYNTKEIYVVTDNGEKKLSYTRSTFDPVSFGTMFHDVYSKNTNYVLDGGVSFFETVLHLSSQFGGADKNTVRTLTRTFKENANGELVLQE